MLPCCGLWVARIKNGAVTDSVSLSDLGIRSSDGQNRASDPEVMEGVIHYAFSHYPATCGNYGLVIEGHGSGWLMKPEVERSRSRAAGVDFGNDSYSGDGRWINVPTMASILKRMPHLKFIMTDCCNMMCLENLYELRSVCDYMIGSPAFYSNIITKYYNATRGYLPLTAVKTSEMDNVARATRTALRTFAPADVYQQWSQVLNRAVADQRESARWATDKPWSMKYADFSASEEKMHGVSMFVP